MPLRKEVIGSATLYCGDCRDVLPTLGTVDAVVTDPPYGIGYVHRGGGGRLAKSTRFGGVKVIGDDKPFDPAPWLGFPEVILWGANHYAERLPSRPSWLIWDKRDGVCSNDQADCELAWTNLRGVARIKRHLWNGMLKASERGIPRVHPTQKPVAIMEWCISLVKGSVILDPFMGSGTTGVACANLGRRFVGIELDPAHFDTACRRIEAAQRDAALAAAA